MHFRLFPQKINDNFFWKIRTILGHLGPFLPKFGQKSYFLEKKALLLFKYSNIYHCADNQKKLMTHSWENSRQTAETLGSNRVQYKTRTRVSKIYVQSVLKPYHEFFQFFCLFYWNWAGFDLIQKFFCNSLFSINIIYIR